MRYCVRNFVPSPTTEGWSLPITPATKNPAKIHDAEPSFQNPIVKTPALQIKIPPKFQQHNHDMKILMTKELTANISSMSLAVEECAVNSKVLSQLKSVHRVMVTVI